MYILEKIQNIEKREITNWLAIILHSKKLHKIQNTWNGSFSLFYLEVKNCTIREAMKNFIT